MKSVGLPLSHLKKTRLSAGIFAVIFCLAQTGVAQTAKSQGGDTWPRWMAIGNSITQHGPRADLKWEGEPRGMAASSVQKDYIHVLQTLLQKQNPANATELKIVGRLGKLSAGTIEKIETIIEELNAWSPDLVTIQLGENDSFKELGVAGFEQRYRSLVDALCAGPKRPVIVCTGVWEPGLPPKNGRADRYPEGSDAAQKDEIIEKICRDKNLIFANIAPHAQTRGNYGTGLSAGVRWHPNDAGMTAYAEAIRQALFSAKSQQGSRK